MTKKSGTPSPSNLYDVIIVGGGPAGLSAALILGRSCRRVLVFDTGKQRNRFSDSLNGYLTRDKIPPAEFLRLAREDLKPYPVEFRNKTVVDAARKDGLFRVVDETGKEFSARKILLATGIADNVPDIPGIMQFYGKSVHHCPYCDGWESCGKQVAIYGPLKSGALQALVMRNWSKHVVLCTGGGRRPSKDMLAKLQNAGVKVYTNRIKALEGQDSQLTGIRFENGELLPCDKLFFGTGFKEQCDLGRKLGCEYTKRKNEIVVNHTQESSVPGVFVSGDAAYEMKLVIIAAGEGAKAAVAINIALMGEDRLRDVYVGEELLKVST